MTRDYSKDRVDIRTRDWLLAFLDEKVLDVTTKEKVTRLRKITESVYNIAVSDIEDPKVRVKAAETLYRGAGLYNLKSNVEVETNDKTKVVIKLK